MTMDNGVMKMRPVDGLDLPAGKPVTLKPGGYHIMLTGLAKPLQEGQSFPLTLEFAKAGAREVTVSVQKVGAMGPGGDAARRRHDHADAPLRERDHGPLTKAQPRQEQRRAAASC